MPPKASKFASYLEESVYGLLIKKGFSPDSIIYEPSPLKTSEGRLYSPDFLIVDPNTSEYLAVIEVKSKHADLSRARQQLEDYKSALGNSRLATYLVTAPEDLPDKLSVVGLDSESKEKEVRTELLPNFDALKASNVAGKKSKISVEQDKTTDSLRRAGITLAILLFLIVATDFTLSFWDIQMITPERLTLVGIAVFLIVMPYFQKFKGLGIEWERVTGDVANKSDKNK